MLSRLLLNPLAPGSSSLHNVGAMSWALTCILSKYRLPEISPQNMYASLPLDLSLVYRSNQSRAQHTSLSSFLISGLFGRSKGLLTYRFWYVRSIKAALASADADRGLHNVNPKFDIPPVSSSPSLLFDILVISAPPVSLSPVASFLSRTS